MSEGGSPMGSSSCSASAVVLGAMVPPQLGVALLRPSAPRAPSAPVPRGHGEAAAPAPRHHSSSALPGGTSLPPLPAAPPSLHYRQHLPPSLPYRRRRRSELGPVAMAPARAPRSSLPLPRRRGAGPWRWRSELGLLPPPPSFRRCSGQLRADLRWRSSAVLLLELGGHGGGDHGGPRARAVEGGADQGPPRGGRERKEHGVAWPRPRRRGGALLPPPSGYGYSCSTRLGCRRSLSYGISFIRTIRSGNGPKDDSSVENGTSRVNGKL
ncbi:hypothetical protein PVAP13_5NG124281 [Panicum virgatum]|uniref:Uncharacterized protein n=1 Tax=Panicum virgatum TaxID=38727 RepID=A0A8T0RLS9_PANVG|nr:hypothetical protein PVAP13_5NG124281 [Panicum virgatum]